jgi:hypothetical protein
MPMREVVRMFAAVVVAVGAMVCFWFAWKNYPPARERLTSLSVAACEFGTVMIRTGAARGHGGGLLVTDLLVVNAPDYGRVELTPPRRIAMRDLGHIRDDARLTVLADLAGGRFYHVADAGAVYLNYDEAAATGRQNALVALVMGLCGAFAAVATVRSVWRGRG